MGRLALACVVSTVLACCGSAYHSTRGATIEKLTLHSVFVHRDLRELLVVPRRHGRWLLVLLHGRGAGPSQFLSQPFFDELAALGRRAPEVLLLDGVGTDDPFRTTDVAYARAIHAHLHVWPGGHATSYWRSHMPRYLAFYARACA